MLANAASNLAITWQMGSKRRLHFFYLQNICLQTFVDKFFDKFFIQLSTSTASTAPNALHQNCTKGEHHYARESI
jgi:hypothetical protein